jgi:hypothetical protein
MLHRLGERAFVPGGLELRLSQRVEYAAMRKVDQEDVAQDRRDRDDNEDIEQPRGSSVARCDHESEDAEDREPSGEDQPGQGARASARCFGDH